jgi:branched-chain amino acid transport system permease protein
MKYLGLTINGQNFGSWFGACVVLAVGMVLFEVTRRRFARLWSRTQEEIEREIQQREAAV